MNEIRTLPELRMERNMTQRDLADALKMSCSAIAMYETGDRTPRLDTAKMIARYFGVSMDIIQFGEVKASEQN